MLITECLAEDAKEALRNKDTTKLAALRLIIAEQKRIEIDTKSQLDDNQMVQILEKMRKQRHDSIAQFSKANREDLIKIEKRELAVIQAYLPEPLADNEIETLIQQALHQTSATEKKDMGKVMAWLKPKLAGRADMGSISKKVASMLT